MKDKLLFAGKKFTATSLYTIFATNCLSSPRTLKWTQLFPQKVITFFTNTAKTSGNRMKNNSCQHLTKM